MLSRDAEHLYWLSRYVERMENTARIINVHSELMLDFTGSQSAGWKPIISSVDSNKLFRKSYSKYSETTAINFLGDDKNNPNSIISCLHKARYNAKSVKDDLPRSSIEQLNNLFYEFSDGMTSTSKRKRASLVYNMIGGSQRFFGIISDNFSRGYEFEFLRLGRFIERVDMISRIIDSMCIKKEETYKHNYATLEWISMLKTLSAHEAFRKKNRGEIEKADVLLFLCKDDNFPRSLYRCLKILERSILTLPNNKVVSEIIIKLSNKVNRSRIETYRNDKLHLFFEDLETRINSLDEKIHKYYFHNHI